MDRSGEILKVVASPSFTPTGLDAPPPGYGPSPRRRRRTRVRAWGKRHPGVEWLIGGIVALAVAAVLGPVAFFHLEGNAPGRLTLPPATGVNAGAVVAGPVSGTWKVTTGSQAGYRVEEILLGQHHTAVGRTPKVTGGMVISGTTVDAADFTVDMAAVTTDEAGRNVQFHDWILKTGTYPDASFHLTKVIHLGQVPQPGKVVTETATGALTLRGKTRVISFPLKAERVQGGIDLNAEIPIVYARWGIPNPSFVVTKVGPTGTIEVLLHLVPAKR
jgi:polyisoprenoid-binding protein YceI